MSPKNRDAAIVRALRLLHRQWEPKKEAKNDGRQKVVVGYYKNGKPKIKYQYPCAKCEGLFDTTEIDMDHIEAVVSVSEGRTDWNDYINRLFVAKENYQRLCKPCHKAKSKKENAERRKNVKSKKG